MEQNFANGTVLSNEIVLAHKEELPVEMDFVLPDSCPDMVKILKCRLEACVLSTEPSSEGVTLEGNVTARVFYIGDDGGLHTAENRSGFTKNCRYDQVPTDSSTVTVIAPGCAEYVNVRAVNQRRVEIKGAMSLSVQATADQRSTFLSDCGGQLECREEEKTVTCPVISQRRTFLLEEEIPIGEANPAVSALLQVQGTAVLTDQKILEGKAATKGELHLRCVYLPESGEEPLVITEPVLPLSFLSDFGDLTEDCICDMEYELVRLSTEVKPDGEGLLRILACRAEIALTLTANREQSFHYFSDAYSVRHPVQCQWQQFQLSSLLRCVDDIASVEKAYEAPMGGVTRILDPFASAFVRQCRQEEDALIIVVRLELGAFLLDANGRPALFERVEEYAHTVGLETGGEKSARGFRARAESLRCQVEGDRIEFSLELSVKGCCYAALPVSAIVEAQVDETTEKTKAGAPLTLYFAREGENVWDIAKRYNAPLLSFMEENDLAEQILPQRTLLLIPR